MTRQFLRLRGAKSEQGEMNASAARGRIGRYRLPASTVGRVALTWAMLIALVPTATATASAAPPSRTQKTAYKILLKTLKGELAITGREVNQGVTAAQRQLAPCLSAIKDYSVPQGAAHALAVELGLQYVGIALHPYVELWIAQDTQTEQLPIGPKLKAALQTEVTQSTAMLQFNTCSDTTAWQAASFAASSEPPGTQLATVDANTPAVHTEAALDHMLSPRQRRRIKPIKKKADLYTLALALRVTVDLQAWVT